MLVMHLFLGTSVIAVYAEDFLAHSMHASILVSNPTHTAEMITQCTEDRGGYFVYKSSELVRVRVPSDQFGSLRIFVEENAEQIVELGINARDLREEIVRLRSGIKSREEILQRNLLYLGRTDVAGTLAIEREIMMLMGEIENLKGRLRKLNIDRDLAQVEVYLSFQEQTLPQDIPSSFEWINTIDFFHFLKEGYD
jgi:hypothetical protein